mmetsp:Transcript_43259/g.84785  ORF Transcript_43259/g.84785 Transcript_43259/m.84785 type:complete len:1343 (-) Transcript_43259:236-4264(-)
MSALSLLMLIGLVVGGLQQNRFNSMNTFLCKRTETVQPGLVQFSMWVFYLSKMFEFIDTFLLVLSKKKLIWLHKIHHLTTMSLVWHAQHINLPSEILCAALNCFVHVIMYFYFARPVRSLRSVITTTQITQFVLVLGALVWAATLRNAGTPCQGTSTAEWHGITIYGVYLFMFANFFVQQYLVKNCKKPPKVSNSDVKVGGELLMFPDHMFEASSLAAWRILAKTVALGVGGILCFARLPDVVGVPVGAVLVSCSMSWLYMVGQDCSTTQFFKSKWLNDLVGTIALLPLCRPLQALRANRQENRAWFARLVSKFFGLSVSHFAVYTFLAAFIPFIVYRFGWIGLFRYWLLPFLAMHLNVGTFTSKRSRPVYRILFPELTEDVVAAQNKKAEKEPDSPRLSNQNLLDLTKVPLYNLAPAAKFINSRVTASDPLPKQHQTFLSAAWLKLGVQQMSKELLLWQHRDLVLHCVCGVVALLLLHSGLANWSGRWAPAPFVVLFLLSRQHTNALSAKKRSRAVQTNQKNELLIDDRVYDVTDFVKDNKHPGGRIITYAYKTNATATFKEFHSRSKKAQAWLKSLPSRKATPADIKTFSIGGDALLKDFAKLRKDLEDEGFFEPSPFHIVYRLAEVAAMHTLGAYLILAFDNIWFRFAGLLVLGIVQGRCGWLMHEGGHYSLTGNIKVDRHIQMLCYGVGCGMSGAWWRNQHNKHHATPQKLKHDVDLDTLPLVAFHTKISEKVRSPILKTWLRFQAYLFAPVSTLLVTLGWQYFLHPRHAMRTGNFLELFYMGLRHVLWGVMCYFAGLTLAQSVGAYIAYAFVGGFYIFLNFAVSHTHKPVVAADEHTDWVRYAANHTTNCTPSLLCNWWMSYLNFQIEHHLFPSMPQFRHPIVSSRVKKLFEAHGLTYDVRDYWVCMRATFQNLHDVGAAAGTAAVPAKKPKEELKIVLNGKVLDVTNWVHKHPGGAKVLRLFKNRDATEQFNAFHSPAAVKRLEAMLKAAPSITPDHPAYVEAGSKLDMQRKSFAELVKQCEAKGLFKANVLHEVIKVSYTVGIWLAGGYLLSYTNLHYLGAFVFALGMQQCGWTGHDYSHHDVFNNPDLNNNIGTVFAWMQGYSLGWWKARHNPHHVMTNEVGNDPDIKTAPLLTYLDNSTGNYATKSLSWLQKQQHIYFVPVLGLLHLYWRIESLLFVLTRLPKLWHHLLALGLHYYLVYKFFSHVPVPAIVLCLFLKGVFTGICVFSTHYGEERLPKDPKMSFAEQTVRTSRNIGGGFLMNWFSGLISLQIEHHLFPMMPTSSYTRVQPLVQAWCKKEGLRYNSDSLLDCVKLNMANLKHRANLQVAGSKKAA